MSRESTGLIPFNSRYLSIVGHKPSHQNKGYGKTLIAPILEKTDKNGITTYLETFNHRNMSFYQRLGFRTIGKFKEPTVNSEYSILAREPIELKK